MKKRFLVCMVVMCFIVSSVAATCRKNEIEVVGYDKETDYLVLMMEAAAEGGTHAIAMGAIYEQQRNLKIEDLGLPFEQTLIFSKHDNPDKIVCELKNYLAPITYAEEDLMLLAIIIQIEAGSKWLSDEWKMCVGNVVLNRVASPEFPNTIKEVFEQKGQYAGGSSSYYSKITPSEKCIEMAKKLLEGERLLPNSVVFQANFPLGSSVYIKYYDSLLGYTYFCNSNYPELYE